MSGISRAASTDRGRGSSLVVMAPEHGAPRVGTLICFEETFPDMARHLADAGAQMIVVQTSDSTFQAS